MLAFIKDWLWGPLLGLIAWAWKWNHDEHKALWQATSEAKDAAAKSSSALNDRIMEHVDFRVTDTLRIMREEDARLMAEVTMQRGNIAKLFDELKDHGRHNENRHNEVMGVLRDMTSSFHQALNQKADK